MKSVVWVVCGLLVGVWTGLSALTAHLIGWMLAAISSGQAAALVATTAPWSPPAWLAWWVDPYWLESMHATLLGFAQWAGQTLPSFTALTGWVVPLIWAAWGLGVAALLALGGTLHWLSGRMQGSLPEVRYRP